MPIDRRNFSKWMTLICSGTLLLPSSIAKSLTVSRPHLYLTRENKSGLRSINEIQKSIQTGFTKSLFEKLVEEANDSLAQPPLTAKTPIAGRSEVMASKNYPDYYICDAIGKRILNSALLHLLTDETKYLTDAVKQIETVLDPKQFPNWIDQSHLIFGHPVDLRTGMLGHDIALAFDWLYQSLTKAQRNHIIEGLERRAINPFLISLHQDPWWMQDKNNWQTVILGGMGMIGMSLSEEHPESEFLINLSNQKMQEYLSIYGEDGSFNESVAYANATIKPVAHAMAYFYHTNGISNPLAQPPFLETALWVMYNTVPPGRVVAFGDANPTAVPITKHLAAIASATKNQVIQWFYKNHLPNQVDALDVLWFDESLIELSPESIYPLGKAFETHGKCIVSRTSWEAQNTHCVVYGKAGREENHEHNDVGQVCIDGFGERLIVDLGSPSSYPGDFFDEGRWNYYNSSVVGHNVIQFGNREQKFYQRERGKVVDKEAIESISGKILQAHFDDETGGFWKLDLTPAYDGIEKYYRTVIHLHPGYVAVLDVVSCALPETISLRWHCASEPLLGPENSFSFTKEKAFLGGRIINLDNQRTFFSKNKHHYTAPNNSGRLGERLEARKEPYVLLQSHGKNARILSVFAIEKKESRQSFWERTEKAVWNNSCKVEWNETSLSVSTGRKKITVTTN